MPFSSLLSLGWAVFGLVGRGELVSAREPSTLFQPRWDGWVAICAIASAQMAVAIAEAQLDAVLRTESVDDHIDANSGRRSCQNPEVL